MIQKTPFPFLVIAVLAASFVPLHALPPAHLLPIAIGPLSIESPIDCRALARLESQRQLLLIECEAQELPVMADTSWGTIVSYGPWPISRLLARSAGSSCQIRFVHGAQGDSVQLTVGTATPKDSWTLDPEGNWLAELLDELGSVFPKAAVSDTEFAPLTVGPGTDDYESPIDWDGVAQWGWNTRVSRLSVLLDAAAKELSAQGSLDPRTCLGISRLWSLQAAYESLSANRSWIVDSGRALAWLNLARRAPEDARDDQKRQSAELLAIIESFLDFNLPPENSATPPLLDETRILYASKKLELDDSRAMPHIQSLYESLARQRDYLSVNGAANERVAYPQRNSALNDGLCDLVDLVHVASFGDSWNSGADFQGSYLSSNYGSLPRNSLAWLWSFKTELIPFLEDQIDLEDPKLWTEPENQQDRLFALLADQTAGLTKPANAMQQLDLCGFGMLAAWNRLPLPPIRYGLALFHDDFRESFLTRFEDLLRARSTFYGKQGYAAAEKYWGILESLRDNQEWRSLVTSQLADGFSVTKPSSLLNRRLSNSIDGIYAAAADMRWDEAFTKTEELVDSNLLTYKYNFTVSASQQFDFGLCSSPLAMIYLRKGLPDQAIQAMTRAATGNFGTEHVRGLVLALASDTDLPRWKDLFRATTTSHLDYFTRALYAFRTGDFVTVGNLVTEDGKHYKGYNDMALLDLSVRLVFTSASRTAANWELLDRAVQNHLASITIEARDFPGWYKAMDRYLADEAGWRDFRDSHHLDLLDAAYDRTRTQYLKTEQDGPAVGDLDWFAKAYAQSQGSGPWLVAMRYLLVCEWATSLGAALAAAPDSAALLDLEPAMCAWLAAACAVQVQGVALNWRTGENNPRLFPLMAAIRAVRYGMPGEMAALFWRDCYGKIGLDWIADPANGLSPSQIGLFSDPAIMADYLSKIETSSDQICRDAINFVSLDSVDTFQALFTHGVDTVGRKMALAALANRDPSLAFAYVPESGAKEWCDQNAPNQTMARDWYRQYLASKDNLEALRAKRSPPLPAELPDVLEQR
jgi:hypothetical protein